MLTAEPRSGSGRRHCQARGVGPGDARGRRRAAGLRCAVSRAARLIYEDELGDLFDAFWHVRPQFMELILTGRQIWCDDVRTDPVETCAELAAAALDAALLDLDRRFGDDPEGWRWGDAHGG